MGRTHTLAHISEINFTDIGHLSCACTFAQGGEQPLRCTWVNVQLQQNVIILLVYALPGLGIVMALAVCFYLFVPQARII